VRTVPNTNIARRLRPLLAQWEQNVDAEALVNEPERAKLQQSGGRVGGGTTPAGGRGRGATEN
jgi:hypothetical protein